MATLASLKNRVNRRLGLDTTASGVDDVELEAALNDGVREVLLRTHCYVHCGDMDLTANVWKYDLPSTILALKTVFTTDGGEWSRVTASEMIALQRGGATADTPSAYAIEGSNLFMVWPTPSTSGEVDVLYVPKPTEMSSGSHDPSNSTYGGVPVEFHHAIVLWACAQAADKEDDQSSGVGQKYMQEFEVAVSRAAAAVNRMGGRPAPATLARRRQRFVSHDPSADW